MILYLYNIDTLNICMKEFIIIVCTDSSEIFFSKLRSACLNYNLPSFLNDSYCAGVSNKHCLLTFFIVLKKNEEHSLSNKNCKWLPPPNMILTELTEPQNISLKKLSL